MDSRLVSSQPISIGRSSKARLAANGSASTRRWDDSVMLTNWLAPRSISSAIQRALRRAKRSSWTEDSSLALFRSDFITPLALLGSLLEMVLFAGRFKAEVAARYWL